MSSNENPYQYHESDSEPFSDQQNWANAQHYSPHKYADSSTITFVIIVLLIAAMLTDFAGVVTGFWQTAVLQNIQSGAYETQEAMQTAATSNDQRVMAVGLVQMLASLILGIVFLFWTYRVCKNAHALNMAPMTNTPGWAVGWYFIPILNLWKPYLALREAFLASCHPEVEQQSGTTLIGVWWFAHIFASILGQVSFRMAMGGGDTPAISQLLVLSGVQIATDVMGVLLNLLTLVIVLRFARCQRETKEKMIGDFV